MVFWPLRWLFAPLLLITLAAQAEPAASNVPLASLSVEPLSLVPELPEGIQVGVPTMVTVPGDRPVLVVHGAATSQRAILYLHGHCGDARAVESWADVVAESGTLIAVLGDRPCGGGRFKWGKKLEAIESRLQAGLAAVKDARGGLLDIEAPVLFGYSQGADRAEALVSRSGRRYRRVVLGGPSRTPRLARLGATDAVAMFGGEFETTGHMRAGAELLAAAGKPARFFLLPRAKHGEFGPDGKRVMSELLSWLLSDPTSGDL